MKTIKTITLIFTLFVACTLQSQVKESYTLSLEGAKKIMKVATDYARANNSPGGAIAITDAGGHVIFFDNSRS